MAAPMPEIPAPTMTVVLLNDLSPNIYARLMEFHAGLFIPARREHNTLEERCSELPEAPAVSSQAGKPWREIQWPHMVIRCARRGD